ncbi:MAG: hypothetical protein PHD02_04675 [Bacilli bacterium]|nr:hypothetical protein [Bacilli bacterium]
MQYLIKYKKLIIITILIILLPIIIPILLNIEDVLFKLGIELGTHIRYILEGYMC